MPDSRPGSALPWTLTLETKEDSSSTRFLLGEGDVRFGIPDLPGVRALIATSREVSALRKLSGGVAAPEGSGLIARGLASALQFVQQRAIGPQLRGLLEGGVEAPGAEGGFPTLAATPELAGSLSRSPALRDLLASARVERGEKGMRVVLGRASVLAEIDVLVDDPEALRELIRSGLALDRERAAK